MEGLVYFMPGQCQYSFAGRDTGTPLFQDSLDSRRARGVHNLGFFFEIVKRKFAFLFSKMVFLATRLNNIDASIVCIVDSHPCNTYMLGRIGSGVIMHPNFPFDFSEKRDCVHHIHIPSLPLSTSWQICFTFHRFNMSESCFDDVLEFPDYTQYCGNGSSLRLNTSNPKSNVFYSDLCCK